MPPPKKASRYSDEFRQLGEAALLNGSIRVPSESPRSLRFYIQSYFRALEREGNPSFADALSVIVDLPGHVIVRVREKSPHSLAIGEALKGILHKPAVSEADAMAERLLSSLTLKKDTKP